MKIDDKILREVLQKKIEQVKEFPRSAQKEVENWMVDKYNARYGDIVDIFNGITPITTLDYDMLYKLMKALHDAIGNRWNTFDLSNLSETIYFTDKEIEQFKVPFNQNIKDGDVVFDEWFQLNPDQYSTKKTSDDMIIWMELNKIIYNPDTQRDLVEKTVNGLVVKQIDINDKAIEQMMELMINDQFISDDIVLNINTDINTSSELLPKIVNGKLIIPQGAQIDLIDGYHRFRAICLTKSLHPEWQFTCGIKIVMFDTERANMFMLQQDKKTHLKKAQAARINQNDESNFIINRLNRNSNSNLKGKITNDLFYDLNILITDIFNPREREDSLPLYEILEQNINELIMKKSYYNVKLTREEWFVYLYCIKKANEEKLDFITLINRLDVDEITMQMDIIKKPLVKHYRLLNKKINEVVKNAI